MPCCCVPNRRIYPVFDDQEMADSPERNRKPNGPTILEDFLTIYPKINVNYRVRLTSDDVIIDPQIITRRRSSVANQIPEKISLKDVTGCHLMKSRDPLVSVAYFCVYFYPYRKKILGKKCRQRRTVTFAVNVDTEFTRNKARAHEWKTAIVRLAQGVDTADLFSSRMTVKKHHLILMNPCSGSGKAAAIYEEFVKPMFVEAEMDYELVVTERANHARDMMRDLPLYKIHRIVVLSGDGLVHEVVNGLMSRPDWETAIQLPIGIIPVGSGNALAAAITYKAGESYSSNFIQHATYVLIKHTVTPMDLMIVETPNSKIASFLSITWGFVADVDIESEKYRKLGSVRFTLGALIKLLSLKTYRGRLSFLPDKPYVSRQRSKTCGNAFKRSFTVEEDMSHQQEGHKRLAKSESLPHLAFRTRPVSQVDNDDSDSNRDLENIAEPADEQDEDRVTNFNIDHQTAPVGGCMAPCSLPPLSEPVPNDWVTLEEDYVTVTALLLSHLSRDTIIHPDIDFDDGLITLAIIRAGTSKAQCLSLMTAMEDASHINSPHIEFIKCHAFRLEPVTPDGCLAVDGELIEYGPVQAQVLPSAARIMNAPCYREQTNL